MSQEGKHMLCLLLRPEEWVRDSDTNALKEGPYVITHQPSGLGLWVANRDYGLALTVTDDSSMGYRAVEGVFTSLDRRELWKLAKVIVKQPIRAAREDARWALAGACARAKAERAAGCGMPR